MILLNALKSMSDCWKWLENWYWTVIGFSVSSAPVVSVLILWTRWLCRKQETMLSEVTGLVQFWDVSCTTSWWHHLSFTGPFCFLDLIADTHTMYSCHQQLSHYGQLLPRGAIAEQEPEVRLRTPSSLNFLAFCHFINLKIKKPHCFCSWTTGALNFIYQIIIKCYCSKWWCLLCSCYFYYHFYQS